MFSLGVQYPLINGPFIANNYEGDGAFSPGESRIDSSLTNGLQKYRVHDGGPEYVNVPLVIGSKSYRVNFPMRVNYDDDTITGRFPYQVLLGTDFMVHTGARMNSGATTISSNLFGTIRVNLNRPMSRWTKCPVIQPIETGASYRNISDPRTIMLFDMDCWEVQVHQRSRPDTIGKPCVAANPCGRIVAVSYEAKKLGINRDSTPYVNQAVAQYPDLIVIEIPERFPGRPDNRIPVAAMDLIVDTIKNILCQNLPPGSIFEYASGDEFYLDVSSIVEHYIRDYRPVQNTLLNHGNSFIYTGSGENDIVQIRSLVRKLEKHKNLGENKDHELRLLHGAGIASYIVQQLKEVTGYQSSVGIAANKLVAKIASGVNKPGSITICSRSGFEKFSKVIKIEDIPKLGGKHGKAIKERFGIETMYELRGLCVDQIAVIDSKNAEMFLKLAHGICSEIVTEKSHPETVSVRQSCFNQTFMFGQIREIVYNLCIEMLDKLQREKKRHLREPTRVSLRIETQDNQTLSFSLTIDRGEGNSLPQIMHDLEHSFWNEPSNYWNRHFRVTAVILNAKFN